MFLLKFVTCIAWLGWAVFVSLGTVALADEYARGVLLTTWAVFVFGPPVILWGISEAAQSLIADSKAPALALSPKQTTTGVAQMKTPTFCPFCGGRELITNMVDWHAESLEKHDKGNTATLGEHQCAGACDGRSFWSGGDWPADPNEAEPSEHPVSICNGKGGLPLAKADAEILAGYLESHEPPSERLCELIAQFCNVLRGHKPSGPPRWHLHGEAGREP